MRTQISIILGILCAFSSSTAKSRPFAPIQNWVIIYLENHSFDNLFGKFPGANNIDSALARQQYLQKDENNHIYSLLPAAARVNTNDTLFRGLKNKPFMIDTIVPSHEQTGDLMHRFIQNQQQIHNGKNDYFVQISDAKALTMGYYQTDSLSIFPYAKNYVLCDRFFQSAFGGSFINHQYLIAAQTPKFPQAPLSALIQLNKDGRIIQDGILATIQGDTFAVNTVHSRIAPHPKHYTDTSKMLPALTYPNIGTHLNQAGISWKWYAGGWNQVLKGHGDSINFQYHHQPFAYFKEYQVGTPKAHKHLKDDLELQADIHNGKLPQVTFWKPVAKENEHPGYANLKQGQEKVLHIIKALERSPQWKNMAIIVTYDENGGFWDHVAPPQGDHFGPGSRIPAIIISPYSKKSFVDKTTYETVSILKTLELRYGLKPLTQRDAKANSFINAFDFRMAQ